MVNEFNEVSQGMTAAEYVVVARFKACPNYIEDVWSEVDQFNV